MSRGFLVEWVMDLPLSNFNVLVTTVDAVRAEDEMGYLTATAVAFGGGDGLKDHIKSLQRRVTGKR